MAGSGNLACPGAVNDCDVIPREASPQATSPNGEHYRNCRARNGRKSGDVHTASREPKATSPAQPTPDPTHRV